MGLRGDILKERVSELDLRELVPVAPSTSIRTVAERMRQARLGCVIVIDDQGRPIGKFTERKLVRMLLQDSNQLNDPVSKHMYSATDCVSINDTIDKVLRLMRSRGLRFICVTDENGKAVALTGQKGVMEYIVEHCPRRVKSQMMESKLHMDAREGA